RSFADYLAAVDKTRSSVRFVSLVGHGTIRMNVMGNDNRDPSPVELDSMKALLILSSLPALPVSTLSSPAQSLNNRL
ncbi:MAG: hypothetical protein LBI75_12845, partial [Brucellaceae bacterium]|nr:hypothetical protein [Brucellaceae bacterium]